MDPPRASRLTSGQLSEPEGNPSQSANLMSVRGLVTVLVLSLLAGGCASTTTVPGSSAERESVTSRLREPTRGEQLVQVAQRFIGTPYRYGGKDPRGFDCSGLVFYSFDQLGVAVPRTAADQRKAARPVDRDDLATGDLVFFRTKRKRPVDHVGIYVGDGRFIHAPSTGRVVSYAYLDDPYYKKRFVSAGRLPP